MPPGGSMLHKEIIHIFVRCRQNLFSVFCLQNLNRNKNKIVFCVPLCLCFVISCPWAHCPWSAAGPASAALHTFSPCQSAQKVYFSCIFNRGFSRVLRVSQLNCLVGSSRHYMLLFAVSPVVPRAVPDLVGFEQMTNDIGRIHIGLCVSLNIYLNHTAFIVLCCNVYFNLCCRSPWNFTEVYILSGPFKSLNYCQGLKDECLRWKAING